jgi:hypothetical protein
VTGVERLRKTFLFDGRADISMSESEPELGVAGLEEWIGNGSVLGSANPPQFIQALLHLSPYERPPPKFSAHISIPPSPKCV